jgi:hypothetical protein
MTFSPVAPLLTDNYLSAWFNITPGAPRVYSFPRTHSLWANSSVLGVTKRNHLASQQMHLSSRWQAGDLARESRPSLNGAWNAPTFGGAELNTGSWGNNGWGWGGAGEWPDSDSSGGWGTGCEVAEFCS